MIGRFQPRPLSRWVACAGLVLGLAIAVVPATPCPASAEAISRAKAKRIAIKALHPRRERGASVMIFGLRRPLRAGQRVVEGGTRARSGRFVRKRSIKPVGRSAWVFWEDLLYNAGFAHPSKLLVVDHRTGAILSRRRLSWYPLIDGRIPPFLRPRGYYGKRYLIYDGVRRRPRRLRQPPGRAFRPVGPLLRGPPASAAQTESRLPADAFKDDCLLIIGDQGWDRRFLTSILAMQQKLRALGLTRQFYVRDGATPPSDKHQRDATPPDGADLIDDAEVLSKPPHSCKDLMLLIYGHGAPATTGGAAEVGQKAKGGALVGQQKVTGADLVELLRRLPNVTFKVKIGSCYSGQFVDLLGPRGKHPTLLTLETSANAKQVSWSKGAPYVSYTDQGGSGKVVEEVNPKTGRPYTLQEGANEPDTFTSGNLAGWERFATSEQEVNRALELGGSLLAHMLDRGFDLGADADFARKEGITEPQRLSNLPTNAAPRVSRITAEQQGSTTTYTAAVLDPEGDALTFQWSTDPNPVCGTFTAHEAAGAGGQPPRLFYVTATWDHPHPPCPSEPIHPATIKLSVSDGQHTKTAVYPFGSQPGRTAPDPS